MISSRFSVRFFPQQGQGDRSGNCPAGLVVDSGTSNHILFRSMLTRINPSQRLRLRPSLISISSLTPVFLAPLVPRTITFFMTKTTLRPILCSNSRLRYAMSMLVRLDPCLFQHQYIVRTRQPLLVLEADFVFL